MGRPSTSTYPSTVCEKTLVALNLKATKGMESRVLVCSLPPREEPRTSWTMRKRWKGVVDGEVVVAAQVGRIWLSTPTTISAKNNDERESIYHPTLFLSLA